MCSVAPDLLFQPPLAWERLLAFLAARAAAGVEWIEGSRYRRTVALGPHRGWLLMEMDRDGALQLEVSPSLSGVYPHLVPRLRRLFDLDAEPHRIAAHLGEDACLRPLLQRHPGLRIPGAFHGFEVALRAVLGQQVSVRAATTLAGRFAAAFGEPVETPWPELSRLTPAPERVGAASEGELAALGLPRARARCIQALAQLCAAEPQLLEGDPDLALRRLAALPGIGEWTLQYLALRLFGVGDAFPHTDLGIRKALGDPGPAAVLAAAERWKPWRGYAALYLWSSLELPP